MKRTLAFVLVFCALAASSFAQKKNPVTTVIKEIMPRQSKNLQAAVDTMPPDKFSFKPTEGQMTFGHLVSHIIESNYYLCAKAADLPKPKVEEAKETDKDALAKSLKASFDFCNESLAKVDDSKLGDEIEAYGGRKVPRVWALIALTATTLAVVVVGLLLPVTPLAPVLGFTVPPLSYFAFLVAATLMYLALVEVVKRRVVRFRAGEGRV